MTYQFKNDDRKIKMAATIIIIDLSSFKNFFIKTPRLQESKRIYHILAGLRKKVQGRKH
jgi:restriction endonuclease S subunit